MTVEGYVNANREAFSKDGRYAIAWTPAHASKLKEANAARIDAPLPG